MQEAMTRIELGGVLGKTFGKTHERLVRTTAEAVRALCCTIDGFEKFLNTSKNRGLTYAVFRGKKTLVRMISNFQLRKKLYGLFLLL